MRVVSVAVAWACRLAGGVADLIGRRYGLPHAPWRKIVCGVHFTPGEFDTSGPVDGTWSLATPLGWWYLWRGRRAMSNPDTPGVPVLIDIWGVSIDVSAGLIFWRWGGRSSVWQAPWKLVELGEGLFLASGDWAVHYPHMPDGQFVYPITAPGQPPPAPYRSDPAPVVYTTRRGDRQEFDFVIRMVMITIVGRRGLWWLGRWQPTRWVGRLVVSFNRLVGDVESGKAAGGSVVEHTATNVEPVEFVQSVIKKYQDKYLLG